MFNKTKFILFTSLSAFLFFSCSNFLEGAKLKEEVENKIAYANSSAVEIQIKSESGTGTVSPNQNVYKKQSDAIDLRFDPNKEYVFLGWQAYQNGTPVNAIEFDDPNALETVARIKSISSGLMIVPKCASRPTVAETNPSSTSISTATIHVIFDQEMDINSFRFKDNEIPDSATPLYDENNTIYAYENNAGRHYKNISIISGGSTNRNSHYGIPILDYSGKTLMIPVNIENVPTVSFGTVTVTIGKNACAKTSANSTMVSSYSFSFKYVEGADTGKPTIETFAAYYPESNDELIEYTDDYKSSTTLYSRKNVLSSISISCKAKDDYGVAGIKVTEQLIRTPSSENLMGDITTYIITDGYTTEENTKTWTSHTFSLQGKDDGLIKLSFAVIDSAGNETPWSASYLVITDYKTDFSYCKIYNIDNSLNMLSTDMSAKKNIEYINESLREIHVEIGELILRTANKGTPSSPNYPREECLFRNPEDYKDMHIMAGTDINNLKRYELEFEKKEFNGYGFDLLTFKTKIDPLSKYKDTIIQLVVTEKDGSKKSLTHAIPKASPSPIMHEKASYSTQYVSVNYVKFLYDENKPSIDTEAFYGTGTASLYSQMYSGKESELRFSSSDYTSSNATDNKLFDLARLQNCRKAIFKYGSIYNYNNASFNLFPMSVYIYECQEFTANTGYHFLAGYVSYDDRYSFRVETPETCSSLEALNPGFKYVFTNSTTYKDDYCKKYQVTIPQNNDTYEYYFEVWECNGADSVENRIIYNESSTITIDWDYFLTPYFYLKGIKFAFYEHNKKTNANRKYVSAYINLKDTLNSPPQLSNESPVILCEDVKSITINYEPDCFEDEIYSTLETESVKYYYIKLDSNIWPDAITDPSTNIALSGKEIPCSDIRTISKDTLGSGTRKSYSGIYYYCYNFPKFSINELDDGQYILAANGKDTKGYEREVIGIGAFSLLTIPNNATKFNNGKILISKAEVDAIIKNHYPSQSFNTEMYYTVETLNHTTNKWTAGSKNKVTPINGNYVIDYSSIKPSSSSTNHWIRLNLYLKTDDVYDQHLFRFVPKYFSTCDNGGNNATCKLKRFENITEVTCLNSSDKPCLVQVFESNTNYGSDYNAWKVKANVLETVSLKEGSNWVYINDVESTKKYCITQIIYADGEEYYTSVRRAN